MEKYPLLFSEFKLGGITLASRFVMAPMTRSRADWKGDVPTTLNELYYAQRSGAGLILTEATYISPQGKGAAGSPGIYTKAQVAAWKKVTDAVHAKNGRIFLQIYHAGRVSHEDVAGLQPVAPSAIRAEKTSTFRAKDPVARTFDFIPVSTPREMSLVEIKATTADFVQAAKNAIAAGFDGIEFHAGHGYLLDQFLRSKSNHRTDEYGGSPAKRRRFAVEVAKAVVEAIGPHRVGVRVSPLTKFKDMDDSTILEEVLDLAVELDRLKIAYLHISDADRGENPAKVSDYYRKFIRERFHQAIVVAGYKTPEEGERLIEAGYADLVAFARPFLANPDYPERVRLGLALNEAQGSETLFGGWEKGYTDYPFAKVKK